MKTAIFAVLMFVFGDLFAEEKNIVFEDEETAIEYNYFNNLLKEYEEGTDSWEEINALLNKEFVRVDHPDYIEVQMTNNLRRYLNGEDSDIED